MTSIETQAALLLQSSPALEGYPLTYDISRAHAMQAVVTALEQKAALQAEFDQHKRDVSDVISELSSEYTSMGLYYADKLKRFILPKHVDPLVEAWLAVWPGDTRHDAEEMCAKLHKAMETMNAKIVEAE